MNEQTASAVGLGVTQAIAIWITLTPNIREIYGADASNRDFAGPMEHAERIAAITALGVGCIGSAMCRNPLPLVVSLLTVGVLYASYEYTLYHPYQVESEITE